MKLAVIEALQGQKKDGWTNFGKDDLTARDAGFNQGIDRAIQFIKHFVTKVEASTSFSFDEMRMSNLDLQIIGERRIAEQIMRHVIGSDLIKIESFNNEVFRAKELRGTLFIV